MRGMKMRVLFSSALLFSSVSPVWAAETDLQELQIQTEQSELYMNATGIVAALAELNCALIDLQTPADVQAAMPAITAAIDSFEQHVQAIPEEFDPPQTEVWKACFAALAEQNDILQSISENEDFQALLSAHEGLMYQLLLRSEVLPVYVGDSQAEYMLMGATDPTLSRPTVVVEKASAVRAEAAARHLSFMKEHADVVTGGNGADVASAIVFASASQKERSLEEQGRFVEQYISAVYPQCRRGYTFRRFESDGSGYLIFMIYTGVCVDESGEQRMINVPVYFRTRAAQQ